jgi:hypothetical protein
MRCLDVHAAILVRTAGIADAEYLVAGDTEISFGTLQPLNVNPGTPVATPIVVTVPVTAEPTKEAGLMDNSIIVAVIGVVTAVIGAVATIFTHKKKE